MAPACNETSNKKNNAFKVMLDLMDIKPERKKRVIHAMFYYMPSQLLLVETEVIVLSYSRNWGIKEDCQSEEIRKQLNLMNSTRQEANDEDGYFQAWPCV